MKGSIRFIAGFAVVFGSVGAIETGPSLAVPLLLAVAGLAVMASGADALKSRVA